MHSFEGTLTIREFSEFLAKNGRPLVKRHINFRRDTVSFSGYKRKDGKSGERYKILNFHKIGNRFQIPSEEAERYLEYLKGMSIDLTYKDVVIVLRKYREVLKQAKKRAMRGDRNFMGKVEDEVRGKLAEQGCANFCRKISGLCFEPYYDLLPAGQKKDEGDFTHCKTKKGREIFFPKGKEIAVKSTNGYFPIAVRETEWDWPGGIYISVRPHLSEDFLLRLINKGIGLEDFRLSGKVGWLEIDGWVSHREMERKAYIGKHLPGKYSDTEFKERNYIMHPLQLHRTRDEFKKLMKRYSRLP